MPINTPENALAIETQIKTDIQRELVDSSPFLPNSYFGAMATGQANRIFDFYIQLQLGLRSLFLDTAQGDDLTRLAAIYGVSRTPASQANGNVVMTGVVASSIPSGTVLASSNGQLYDSTAAVVIGTEVAAISGITQVSGLATVTTDSPHGLSNNVQPVIAGADQTEYNGAKTITVTSDSTFTFNVSPTTISPATGIISASYDIATVPVISQEFQDSENDVDVNQPALTVLTLQSPIVGVDNDGGVDFGAIGGGSDQQSDEDLRATALDELQNPVAHFNVSDIVQKAKEVPGVTRVFVLEVTPELGQVTIYFTRDNDDDPIPDGSEIATVKDKILEIKPANTSDDDVIVEAPIANEVDFTFSQLIPNTASMQSAVNDSLLQFFQEEVSVGQNVDQDLYRAAIANTVDLTTGDTIQTFAITTPSGDVIVASNELPVLGAIVYP